MNKEQKQKFRREFQMDTVDGQAAIRSTLAIQMMFGQCDRGYGNGRLELLDFADPELIRRSKILTAYMLITKWIDIAPVPRSLIYLGAAQMIAELMPDVAAALRLLSNEEQKRTGSKLDESLQKLHEEQAQILLISARRLFQ